MTTSCTFRTVLTVTMLITVYFNSMAQEPSTIRVLTYNVYHGETMKGNFDLDLISATIKSVNPDLVALQEVDVHTDRAMGMDIVTELAQRTGLIPTFGSAMPFSNGYYGVGILSKHPIVKSQNHKLPSKVGHEPRTALEIWVALKSKDTIRFVSTHLDNMDENSDRLNQAKFINQTFADKESYAPTILAGDLNALPDSETMKIFYNHWQKSFTENTPTSPSSNPQSKIDYILYRPQDRWEVIATKVIQEPMGSDHLPVLSVLRLLPRR